jgi:hypothetical protein
MNKSEWLRAYGSSERVMWIIRHPSVVSGRGPCVNAHVRTGGVGRKADAKWIIPITFKEHNELHQHGQKTFEQKHGIDLLKAAEKIEAEWQNRKDHFE